MKKEINQLEKSGKVFAYWIVIPALIHFMIFYVYINFSTIILAFSVETVDGAVFSLSNFEKLFLEIKNQIIDPVGGKSELVLALGNTLKYFTTSVVKTFLSAIIAYFFFKKVYLHKVYKILFFLPSMIPGLVYVMIFKEFINTYGPVGHLLYDVFNYELPVLLSDPATATSTIIFYVMWSGFGAQMLIFVGVMNRIPLSVIEAANLDGCTGFNEFARIVIPLIWETLSTYLLIGIACIFMASGPLLYFTNGAHDTFTLSFWIFKQVHGNGNYNYPAAIGLIFTVLALPLMFLSRFLMSKIETITY
jgi:multiple sugar transport system permease protein